MAHLIVNSKQQEQNASTLLVTCSNCKGHISLTYIFINYCPICGIPFERDQRGVPEPKDETGISIAKINLSGFHSLKEYGILDGGPK